MAERTVRARAILAANVQALLDREIPPHPKKGRWGQITKFVDDHRIRKSLSKIQRAVKDGGVNMDTVEQLAKLFGVEPYQLLIDKLDVKEPQVVIPRRLYGAAMRIAGDLIEGDKH